MDSVIRGLTRAAADADEPAKAVLTSAVTELQKLKPAMAGILEQVHIKKFGVGEGTLRSFVGDLDIISSVAEEPLKTWLKEMGKALLDLGDAMAMPPPPPPLVRLKEEIGLKGVGSRASMLGLGALQFGESVKKEQPSSEGAPEATQTALPLRFTEGILGRPKVRLPRSYAMGGREAQIEVPDGPIIKCEPEADEEKFNSLEEGELRDTTPTGIPLYGRMSPPFFLGVPTGPRYSAGNPKSRSPIHSRPPLAGKPSSCFRCNQMFPSRTKLLKHLGQEHDKGTLKYWQEERHHRLAEENARLPPSMPEPRRKRSASGFSEPEQMMKRRGGLSWF